MYIINGIDCGGNGHQSLINYLWTFALIHLLFHTLAFSVLSRIYADKHLCAYIADFQKHAHLAHKPNHNLMIKVWIHRNSICTPIFGLASMYCKNIYWTHRVKINGTAKKKRRSLKWNGTTTKPGHSVISHSTNHETNHTTVWHFKYQNLNAANLLLCFVDIFHWNACHFHCELYISICVESIFSRIATHKFILFDSCLLLKRCENLWYWLF